MKEQTTNSTVNYEPVVVSDETSIYFTKVTTSNNVAVYGKIVKAGAEVGNVSFDKAGGYLITSLKPYSDLTQEEVVGVYQNVPGCIKEMNL